MNLWIVIVNVWLLNVFLSIRLNVTLILKTNIKIVFIDFVWRWKKKTNIFVFLFSVKNVFDSFLNVKNTLIDVENTAFLNVKNTLIDVEDILINVKDTLIVFENIFNSFVAIVKNALSYWFNFFLNIVNFDLFNKRFLNNNNVACKTFYNFVKNDLRMLEMNNKILLEKVMNNWNCVVFVNLILNCTAFFH